MDLRTLVTVAPFDDRTKTLLTDNITNGLLDEAQQMKLSELCWDMILSYHEHELAITIENMQMEVAEGKKHYTHEDYQKAKDGLVQKVAELFEKAGADYAITEVQKQLAGHSSTPLPPKQSS